MEQRTTQTGARGTRGHMLEAKGAEYARELGLDVAAFGVGSNLHWASTLMKTHFERRRLDAVELSMSEFVTLWSIRVGGEMEAGDVAAEVGIPPSSFTGLAKRLEQRGLVSRRRHPADGRSVLVDITPAGADLVAEAFRLANAGARAMTSALRPDEVAVLGDLLLRVADALAALLDDG
jgi:DNA-binding MarR family transcriptional regulator